MKDYHTRKWNLPTRATSCRPDQIAFMLDEAYADGQSSERKRCARIVRKHYGNYFKVNLLIEEILSTRRRK